VPTAICNQCRTEFYAAPHEIAAGNGLYCSKACFGMAHRKHHPGIMVRMDPDMAWALGLLASDGSVSRRGQVTLAVRESDRELADKLMNVLGFGAIHIYPHYGGLNAEPLATWLCSSRGLAEELRSLGLTETKTYDLTWPECICGFEADFLRGYWDGDGSFGTMRHGRTGIVYPIAQITGCSENFFGTLHGVLAKVSGSRSKLQRHARGYFQLFYGGNPACRIMGYLYKNAPESLRLNRKWALAQALIN